MYLTNEFKLTVMYIYILFTSTKSYCTPMYKNALKTKNNSSTCLLLLMNVFNTKTLYKSEKNELL